MVAPRGFSGSRVVVAFRALGWRPQEFAIDGWTAVIGLNMCSWGELVRVAWVGPGRLLLRSECRHRSQCFDWGKNRRNVRRLRAMIELTSA